jgi:hypothetical protein
MKSRIEDSSSLFQLGPVRLYRDRKARQIVIETTKDHAEGCGIEICRLPESRMREAQAIANLPALIKAGGPFAALGIMVMEANPEDPLIYYEEDVHVTVKQAHAFTDAIERVCVPPERRRPKPWHKDAGPKLKP